MIRPLVAFTALTFLLSAAGPARAGVAESPIISEPVSICAWQVQLTYTDVRSERNTVVVADAQTPDLNPHFFGPGPSPCVTFGGIAVVDAEAPVIAGEGCVGFSGRDAVCSYPVIPFPGPHLMAIDLGPMNDSIRVADVPHQVTVQLGSGSDNGRTLNGRHDTIACGPGVDHVVADSVDSVAADCEDVIRG